MLVLQDTATRLQVVLEVNLPPTAYEQLCALDLSTFPQGPLHYDRHQARWCTELDEWANARARRDER